MNKKIIVFVIMFVLAGFSSACGIASDGTVTVNVETEDCSLVTIDTGVGALKKIGGQLYYDANTNIVYFWNEMYYGNCSTMPSPYYAPNGLPYKYNSQTNTLYEIEMEEKKDDR